MGRQQIIFALPLLLAFGCARVSGGATDCFQCPKRSPTAGTSADWSYLTPVEPLYGPEAAARFRIYRTAERVMPAVVYVTTWPGRSVREGSSGRVRPVGARFGGTGVVVANDGVVLTSAHVLEDATAALVTAADGTERVARRIVIDPDYDLAFLFTDAIGVVPLPLSAQESTPGSTVIALRGPRPGKRWCQSDLARVGVVENLSQSLQWRGARFGNRDYRHLIETTAALDPGFSGGPLLDGSGHLIGINVAAVRDPEVNKRLGYALPLDSHMIQILNCLRSGRNAKRSGTPAPIEQAGPDLTAKRIQP